MKPIRLRQFLFPLTLLISLTSFAQNNLPQLGKSSVADVLKAMTTEEKVKMLVGFGFKIPGLPANFLPPTDPADDSVKEKVPGTSGRLHGVARLGVLILTVADGPAGVHIWSFDDGPGQTYATALPNATLLAATWDEELVTKLGGAFGNEAKEYGIDIVLAPAMNIQRNPLNGRNFEYYSEDPVLSGNISAAMVKGVQSQGVGVSVKHFVANNAETNRNKLNTIVSLRALREIYLRGFEITVKKSDPWTIMSSYNKVNGVYTSESRDLLTTILRNEWGFKGFVMSDWFGGSDAVAQTNAGNNLLMPGGLAQIKSILSAVQHDSISIKQLDENVIQILNIILLSPTFKNFHYTNQPDLTAHAALSRTSAADGMVLLKNEDNTLPIKTSNSVALFGNSSYDIIAGGTGSGDVHRKYTVSLIDGFVNAGVPTEATLTGLYKTYIQAEKAKQPKASIMTIMNPPPPIKEMNISDSLFAASIGHAGIAVYSIGRNAGEGKDRQVENDFNLTDAEKNTIQKLSSAMHARHKKLVVVINSGSVIETASWRDYADAILLAWQPGMEGGNAMADVLTGKVNPSGKLPETFPVAYADVPSAKNFPGKETGEAVPKGGMMDFAKPAVVTYEDGIYVGYRYYASFKVKPAFAFGYGLSYTKFDYHDLKLSSENFKDQLTATVTITNKGKVAGREVVELYLTAPKGSLDKPALELKAFAKTGLLNPGASETVTLVLNTKDLASFDTNQLSWIAAAGSYEVKIGASSEDIKLSKSFKLDKELVVEKVTNALAPTVAINELK
jgi:beta-glucosidase